MREEGGWVCRRSLWAGGVGCGMRYVGRGGALVGMVGKGGGSGIGFARRGEM